METIEPTGQDKSLENTVKSLDIAVNELEKKVFNQNIAKEVLQSAPPSHSKLVNLTTRLNEIKKRINQITDALPL